MQNPPTAYHRYLSQTLGSTPLRVLDLGCGIGADIRFLVSLGHDAYGCDVVQQEASRRERLGPIFGETYEAHVHLTTSEDQIPFEDDMFDVIIANTVFEHVKLLAPMLSECARVLKPGGRLIANFPTALVPMEPHVGLPFVHWLPPGKFRRRYIGLLSHVFPASHRPGMKTEELAAFQDRYLRTETYYRFLNEITSVGEYYFNEVDLGTREAFRTKLASASRKERLIGRVQMALGNVLGDEMLSSLFTATFIFRAPRKTGVRPVPEQWTRAYQVPSF